MKSLQSLGSLPKDDLISRLVLSFSMTLDGVNKMNRNTNKEYVKLCKIHGNLTEKEVYRTINVKKIDCKKCKIQAKIRYEQRKKMHGYENKIEKNIRYKKEGILKFCPSHGELKLQHVGFHKNNIVCSFCQTEKNRTYSKLNSSIIKIRKREDYRNNVVEKRKKSILSNKNYTIEQYDKLIKKQKGKCEICKKPEVKINKASGEMKPLCLDHNHKTGKVRGLLCSKCNYALGFYSDSPSLLEKAAEYLRRHSK